MRVARRVLSPGKGTTFAGREIVASRTRHPVRAPSHFGRCCECWAPKASSPAQCLRGASRCASQGFAKTGVAKIAKIKEKCEIYLRNIVHFAAKPPRESTAKTIVFCWFSTVFAQLVVGVITPLRRVVRKLRNFAKYCESLSFSQGFRKVFAKFFF